MSTVAIIIPFYNEIRFIEEVITRALPFCDYLIAVDDGSTDGTISKIPANDKIHILSIGKNRGKGYALNVGFKRCIELKVDFIVTLDADLQHEPEQLPQIISQLLNYNLVIGVRKKVPGTMPIARIISNTLTTFLLGLKTGYSIKDSQSGFRGFNRAVLETIALPTSEGFEAESEILVYLCRKKITIGFVEIPTIYGTEESKMKNIKAIIGFLKILLFS